MAACRLNVSPRTSRPAASCQASRAVCARASMSAILNWIAWYVADRVAERLRAAGRSAATRRRSPGPARWPAPRSRPGPRRGSAGTGRSRGRARRAGSPPAPVRRRRSARGCPRRTSRPWSSRAATVKPGRTGRHQDRGDLLAPVRVSPVTAATATTAVMSVPELVMNALLPLMTHSSVGSSSTARVCAPPASEPKPGSVSPNAASASPVTSRGSQVCLLLRRCRTGRSAWRPARPRPPG